MPTKAPRQGAWQWRCRPESLLTFCWGSRSALFCDGRAFYPRRQVGECRTHRVCRPTPAALSYASGMTQPPLDWDSHYTAEPYVDPRRIGRTCLIAILPFLGNRQQRHKTTPLVDCYRDLASYGQSMKASRQANRQRSWPFGRGIIGVERCARSCARRRTRNEREQFSNTSRLGGLARHRQPNTAQVCQTQVKQLKGRWVLPRRCRFTVIGSGENRVGDRGVGILSSVHSRSTLTPGFLGSA